MRLAGPRPVSWSRFITRKASTTANPYPYPAHANPTPHQIFHLPQSASKAEVKARYYELVRIYHPDSPVSRILPAATAQARFQAITSAYDALRGRAHTATGETGSPRADFHDLSTAMWRAKQRRRAELNGGLDERWKDRMILGAVVLTIGAFVAQTYSTRAQALAAALEGSRPRPGSGQQRRARDEPSLAAADADDGGT